MSNNYCILFINLCVKTLNDTYRKTDEVLKKSTLKRRKKNYQRKQHVH